VDWIVSGTGTSSTGVTNVVVPAVDVLFSATLTGSAVTFVPSNEIENPKTLIGQLVGALTTKTVFSLPEL
jgi:hypothetical protein